MSLNKRQREQLDSLYWAGRAKELGLTQRGAVRKAQLDSAALARVTARITQPADRGNGYATVPPSGKSDMFDALRYASLKFNSIQPPLTIKRPARYGKTANFLIVDDLVAEDLFKTMRVELS